MTGLAAALTPWLSLLGAAFGLVTLLGGAYLTVRAGQAQTWRQVAEAQRANADAEKARGDRLEQELRDLARRVEVLEAENRALRKLHDNTEKLDFIIAMLTRGASK